MKEQINEQNKVERKVFTTKRLVLMAMFTALSYVVSFLEIPLFAATPASFLKLDFGNVFILLISFLLGPMEGIIVCILKELLRLIGSSSGGVGEIANALMTVSYIALPAIVYQYRKGIKTVLVTLGIACLIGTGTALLVNRIILFPLYAELMGGSIFGMTVEEAFAALWGFIVLFNLIKTVSIGSLTMLLYKRLSNFIKRLKV